MPFPSGGGISQLTGDVTAGPGTGSQAATLVGTTAVSNTVGALGSVSTEVTRRSATATAVLGECTEFTGSTGSQTITLPVISGGNNGAYRIINNSSVSVNILGGTNSISIFGTIYSASTPFTVAAGYGYDFVYDQTGIWICMAVTRPASAGAITLISSSILGSAGSFDFTSIPGTYNHLRLQLILRSSAAALVDNFQMTFNGDTGANYSHQALEVTNSTVTAVQTAGDTLISPYLDIYGNNAIANYASLVTVDIPCYSLTTFYKTVFSLAGTPTDGTNPGRLYQVASSWNSTAAINRVTIIANVTPHTFLAGSAAYLYGIT